MTRDARWGTLGGMEPVAFDLAAAPTGYGKVVLDGRDVTGQVVGYVLQVHRGTVPRLTLELDAAGSVEGVALVEAPVEGDMLEQLAQLIDATDAVSLEQQALDSQDLGNEPGAVTDMCLKILAGRLRARA